MTTNTKKRKNKLPKDFSSSHFPGEYLPGDSKSMDRTWDKSQIHDWLVWAINEKRADPHSKYFMLENKNEDSHAEVESREAITRAADILFTKMLESRDNWRDLELNYDTVAKNCYGINPWKQKTLLVYSIDAYSPSTLTSDSKGEQEMPYTGSDNEIFKKGEITFFLSADAPKPAHDFFQQLWHRRRGAGELFKDEEDKPDEQLQRPLFLGFGSIKDGQLTLKTIFPKAEEEYIRLRLLMAVVEKGYSKIPASVDARKENKERVDKMYEALREKNTVSREKYSREIVENEFGPVRFNHDCNECLFLGQDKRADLYFCSREEKLIYRYGEEDAYLTSSFFTPKFVTAYKRAERFSLIPELKWPAPEE